MPRFSHHLLSLYLAAFSGAGAAESGTDFDAGRFLWKASAPLVDVGPEGREAADPHIAVKDPTVVSHEGRWHVFATVRMKSGKVGIEYFGFADWPEANAARRHLLGLHAGYHGAPQVFYFTPHRRWYLIYQFGDPSRTPPFGPCFSTSTNISDPGSWTKPETMRMRVPVPEKPAWLDFWVIADATKAHLFYTSLRGEMWRRETSLADFPHQWSEPQLALKADIFEASHTYKLKGRDQFLTLIEAQAPGRRYYKAYLADRLEGPWRGLADTLQKPFAARENIRQSPVWTDSISHGELIRTGTDERLEIDPSNLRLLFQGVSEAGYRAQGYGGIPWRLGLLEITR